MHEIRYISLFFQQAESIDAIFIIESVIDKETGEAIDNPTLFIHVEREGKEGIVFEDYAKWHLVMHFKNAGFVKLPVELEKEVEGIEG